ncbi:hypothetical protein Fot_01522 [Forsythia ovata]|uniref:Uncharacterized protein n=1 Tax=Forsythia ovata TaxID=205694 RepID=A0ABD1X464_9LAMI
MESSGILGVVTWWGLGSGVVGGMTYNGCNNGKEWLWFRIENLRGLIGGEVCPTHNWVTSVIVQNLVWTKLNVRSNEHQPRHQAMQDIEDVAAKDRVVGLKAVHFVARDKVTS